MAVGCSSVNYQAQETRSRLSKTVDQVMRDSVALPYFLHFLESRSAEHLARFWLEAESFRSTSWSRVRAHSLNSVKHSSLAEAASAPGCPASPGPSASHDGDPRDGGEEEADEDDEDTFTGRTPSSPADCISHCGDGTRQTNAVNHSRLPSTSSTSSRTGTPVKGPAAGVLRELSDKLMKSE